MTAMRTSNPALSDSAFDRSLSDAAPGAGLMTIQGTVIKTAMLVGLLLISGAWSWWAVVNNDGLRLPLMLGGLIGGLVIAMICIFVPKSAPITAPLYAIAEGLAIGSLSQMFETEYSGIVLQAGGLTAATLISLLLAYMSGLIKATENFKLGVIAATGGVFLVYIASFILRFIFPGMAAEDSGFFAIHGSGMIGIGFSLVVVTIAALNLVLDFDFIETGAEQGAPKYMEWYAGFGLLVTLVWLYLEILRLLAKLRD